VDSTDCLCTWGCYSLLIVALALLPDLVLADRALPPICKSDDWQMLPGPSMRMLECLWLYRFIEHWMIDICRFEEIFPDWPDHLLTKGDPRKKATEEMSESDLTLESLIRAKYVKACNPWGLYDVPWRLTLKGISRLDLEQRLIRCHLYAKTIRQGLLDNWPRVAGKPVERHLAFRDDKGKMYWPTFEKLWKADWLSNHAREGRSYVEQMCIVVPEEIVTHKNWVRQQEAVPEKERKEMYQRSVKFFDGYDIKLKMVERAFRRKAKLYYDPAPHLDWIWCNNGTLPMMDSVFVQEASLKEATWKWNEDVPDYPDWRRPWSGDAQPWIRNWMRRM
jgi:hypothetical protein